MRRLDLATTWGTLRLEGGSRAGEGSVLLLPQLRLALDAGHPLRALVPASVVVITHGHTDHLLALPGWASQRQLQQLPPATVFAPRGIAADIAELLALSARLEGGAPYRVEVVGVSAGTRVPLRRDFALRFFATSHWTETLGCCLEWRRQRLRPEFVGLDAAALAELRRAGRPVTEEVVIPLLAATSDTGPEVFQREPWLGAVEVLVCECTFLAAEERDRARRFGHMHLDDLLAIAPRLAVRHLVLSHLSRRQPLLEGEARIREAVEPLTTASLHFINTEWP